MSAQERNLRLVDVDTGEQLERCPSCSELQKKLDMAERDVRGKNLRIHNLEHDRERSAINHPKRTEVEWVHAYWRKLCRHPRTTLDAEAVELIGAALKRHEKTDGLTLALRAVAGGAYDAYETTRRNGSKQRHDGVGLIFRNEEKFTEFVNRAPKDWSPPAEAELRDMVGAPERGGPRK